MPRFKGEKIDLVVDGKTIEIKKPSRRNFELNKALLNPGAFQDFARNPRAFAARYDLNIDAGYLTSSVHEAPRYHSVGRGQELSHTHCGVTRCYSLSMSSGPFVGTTITKN